MPVVSPGTQKRNITDVRDIVNGLPVKMLPARKGNRLDAPVLSDKTTALGWAAKYFLKDYIKKKKSSK